MGDDGIEVSAARPMDGGCTHCGDPAAMRIRAGQSHGWITRLCQRCAHRVAAQIVAVLSQAGDPPKETENDR